MSARPRKKGTLRSRMAAVHAWYDRRVEQAQQLSGPKRRANRLAALARAREDALRPLIDEKQALILSVYDWVWRRVNDFYARYHLKPQDRDDLAGAAFARVCSGAETYDPAKSMPTTYFGYVAWDGMMKWLKTRSLIAVPDCGPKAKSASIRAKAVQAREAQYLSLEYRGQEDRVRQWESPAPEEPVYEPEEWAAVKDALRFLPPRDQQVLQMRYMEGCTLEEAGQKLGISKERIRQLQKKAVASIRQRLGITN